MIMSRAARPGRQKFLPPEVFVDANLHPYGGSGWLFCNPDENHNRPNYKHFSQSIKIYTSITQLFIQPNHFCISFHWKKEDNRFSYGMRNIITFFSYSN